MDTVLLNSFHSTRKATRQEMEALKSHFCGPVDTRSIIRSVYVHCRHSAASCLYEGRHSIASDALTDVTQTGAPANALSCLLLSGYTTYTLCS